MERKLREMEAALTTRQQANTPRLSSQPPAATGTTPRPGRTTTTTVSGSSAGVANGGGGGGGGGVAAHAPTPARAAATPPLVRQPPNGAGGAAPADAGSGGEAAAPSVAAVAAAVGPTPTSARVVTGSGMRRSVIATPPLVRADGAGAAAAAAAAAGDAGRGRPEGIKVRARTCGTSSAASVLSSQWPAVETAWWRASGLMLRSGCLLVVTPQLEQERAVADSLAAAGVSYKRLGDGTLVFTFE